MQSPIQPDRLSLPTCCPEQHLHRHGYRLRKSRNLGDFWILRFYCTKCKHTISVLPLFLMFLKQYDTDTIFSGLHAWYRDGLSVKQIAEDLGLAKSTLRDWINGFEYNSKNFGLEEYQLRLEMSFGARLNPRFLSSGKALFSALKEMVDSTQMRASSTASRIKRNFFFPLKQALAKPTQVDGVDLPILGVFRIILDRGG